MGVFDLFLYQKIVGCRKDRCHDCFSILKDDQVIWICIEPKNIHEFEPTTFLDVFKRIGTTIYEVKRKNM